MSNYELPECCRGCGEFPEEGSDICLPCWRKAAAERDAAEALDKEAQKEQLTE